MDEQQDQFPIQRIRGGGLGPSMLAVALIVVALGAAIVKPWDIGSPAPADSPEPAAVLAQTPSPSPSPSGSLSPFDGPFGLVCYGGQSWRLVMREANGAETVRTWYDLVPVTADGPADPAIQFLRVHSEGILSLGYCTNSDTAGLLTVAGTAVWRVPANGVPVRIGPMRVSADSPPDPNNGSLFVPPVATDGSIPAHWAAGRYVFEVTYEGPFAAPSWFGVEVIDVHPLDEPGGLRSPPAAPSPSATLGPTGFGSPAALHLGDALLR
ncbi:MAG TPA: hypothetical protein VEG29_05345 [Candidatus Binatia bacterium]|nr:hypothetical protein [Candidatus Binatia bacterium]